MTASAPLSLEIDQEAGAAYLQFSDSIVTRTVEHTADILVDLDEHDIVVGIEILNLHKTVDLDDLTSVFHVHTEALAVLLKALRSSAPSGHVSAQTASSQYPRPFGAVDVPQDLSPV